MNHQYVYPLYHQGNGAQNHRNVNFKPWLKVMGLYIDFNNRENLKQRGIRVI